MLLLDFYQRSYSQNPPPRVSQEHTDLPYDVKPQPLSEGLQPISVSSSLFVYFCYRKFFDYPIEHLQKQRYNR